MMPSCPLNLQGVFMNEQAKQMVMAKGSEESQASSSEQIGIKETKEALVGINELGLFFVERFKDGRQMGDFVAFWDKLKNDQEFYLIVQEAYRGIHLVPKETDNMDLKEGLELVTLQLSYIPKFIEALKVEPAKS